MEERARFWALLERALSGRILYVVPYMLGSLDSKRRQLGVQLTDSREAVLHLRMLARVGERGLDLHGHEMPVVRSVHVSAEHDQHEPISFTDPERLESASFGATDVEDSVASYRRHALDLARFVDREGFFAAARMALIGVVSPAGNRHYMAVSLPPRSGKTELAMLQPSLSGWRIETVSDDVCWFFPGHDGRLWAMNPNRGLTTLTNRVTDATTPHLHTSLAQDAAFTAVALRRDGSVWWEGLAPTDPDEELEDWSGRRWTSRSATPAAHPRGRITMPMSSCVTAGLDRHAALGVPVSAVVFGQRRSVPLPLVLEAKSWLHGAYLGATMAADDGVRTPAVTTPLGLADLDEAGPLRDWLALGSVLSSPPRVFGVSWFTRSPDGALLWPGFGANIRVLRWIFDRLEGRAGAHDTPVGRVPTADGLDLQGLALPTSDVERLLSVDVSACLTVAARSLADLDARGLDLPQVLRDQHALLSAQAREKLH